jgi:C-1 hydroxylase
MEGAVMDRRLILDRADEALAALNRGDAAGVVANTVVDVLWRDVAFPMPLHGRDALRSAVEGYLGALPDLRIEVTSMTFEEPRLALEWTVTATHRGELMGLPPTGRAIKTYGATVAVFDEDGLVIEGMTYWNMAETMRQLGMLPVAVTA